MKNMKKYCLAMLGLALWLPGCATVTSGAGPHGRKSDLSGPVQTRRDVTFSVDFQDDYGPEAWFDEEDIIMAIREGFERSGLFRRVLLVPPGQASARHYHFRVNMSGTPMNERMGWSYLSGITLLCIPTWYSLHLDWSMSYLHQGQEVMAASSHQKGTDILWLPGAVTWPFLNHWTVGKGMCRRPVYYFISQIREKQLNELP